MDSASPVHKNILKKDDLESSDLICDAWLLPEVKSHHVVHCKESSEVRKKAAGKSNQESVQSSGSEEERSDEVAPTKVNEQESLVEKTDDADTALTNNDEIVSENFSPATDLVPETLSEFNEPLTLARLQQKVDTIQLDAWRSSHEQGLKSGYEDGRAKAETELQSLANQVEQLTGQLNNLLNEQQETLQSALLSMVIQIVERLTKSAVEQNPDILNQLLQEALELYPQHAEKPTVSLCQQDYDLMKKNGLIADHCLWSVDNSVSPGGFLVKGKYAEIDQRYETRLQQIIDQYFAQ